MFHNHIGVLCVQETHNTVSEYYIIYGGFLLKLSGDEDGCLAGVGFIVVPHCRRCVVNFCPESCRQTSVKLRVPGGKMVICSSTRHIMANHWKKGKRFFKHLQIG